MLYARRPGLPGARLAEALDDRASFRRFCSFAVHEPTPERTAFVWFRAELVRCRLDRSLFEAVTRQLDGRSVVVRTGTLVDATLLPSASIQHDPEAKWVGHRRHKAAPYAAEFVTLRFRADARPLQGHRHLPAMEKPSRLPRRMSCSRARSRLV